MKLDQRPKKIDPFEFQNWDVYKRSVELVKVCREIALDNQSISIKGLTDQLTRASLSIPMNIAEGYSRYGKKDKKNKAHLGSIFENFFGGSGHLSGEH